MSGRDVHTFPHHELSYNRSSFGGIALGFGRQPTATSKYGRPRYWTGVRGRCLMPGWWMSAEPHTGYRYDTKIFFSQGRVLFSGTISRQFSFSEPYTDSFPRCFRNVIPSRHDNSLSSGIVTIENCALSAFTTCPHKP